MQQIITEGSAHQFEFKAQECIVEAGRLRDRMVKRNQETLLELYLEKLRTAATYLSLAAEKINGPLRPENKDKARGKDPSGSSEVP